jgi:hypothetical protein
MGTARRLLNISFDNIFFAFGRPNPNVRDSKQNSRSS